MIVRWRTNAATDSVVQYGPNPGSLNQSKSDATLTTEHEIKLTGLSSDTVYYYSVGSSAATLAGADNDHFFLTAPTPGTSKPLRIWAIGDSGTGSTAQADVYNAYTAFTGSTHTDFWIMLGDNAYNSGTDQQYQEHMFDVYPELLRKSAAWLVLGNHDLYDDDFAYADIVTNPALGEAGGYPSYTERYYSFDYGNIHVISFDSQQGNLSQTGAMYQWAENDPAKHGPHYSLADSRLSSIGVHAWDP